MIERKTLWLPFAVLFGAVVLAGCNSPVSPGAQPQISNALNNFQYQVTATRNFTDVATYQWQNTGTAATVNFRVPKTS